MSELLDYNVRLSDLQSMFSAVFEDISDKRRKLDNMEERKIEKKFSLELFCRNVLMRLFKVTPGEYQASYQ